MKKFILLLVLAFGFKFYSNAQQQKVIADKIIAQVGDNIILQSDIDNAIRDNKRNAAASGTDASLPPDFECVMLRNMLMRKVLMIQAQRDSLPVSDEDIDAKLDNKLRQFVRMAGSRDAFEANAGKSLFQFREDMRPYFKEQELSSAEQQSIVKGIKITPEEVESFYNKIPKDSLPYFEAEYEVSQIIMHPKANKEVEDYLSEQLMGYKKEVESGKRKFDELAKIYSQDPGSKDNGGMYNINRTTSGFDPKFVSAAFRLKDGQISPVVKTQFGYHLIQMVSRVGDDAVVRHILLVPPINQSEIKEAQDSMTHVRALILDKVVTFNAAVSLYGDDESGKYTGGAINSQDGSPKITIDDIKDPALVKIVTSLQPGEISTPSVFKDPSNMEKESVRIVFLRSKTDAHRENLKDDYDVIANEALNVKKEKVLDQWFLSHIPQYYVHLDDNAIGGCTTLNQWKQVSDQLEKEQNIMQ